ncbi:hypothetical protein CVT26_014864 [Gymnopilus dilepis]|uniref:NADP-dependent oxidoreductase domain-containing protein n=1 Tax=Gymnopilus dilepis TaxID=231916 RepID=A0A409XWZ7_9AGAR|nr:hypothetical protein CVT26_014864 [Gymnopilus dilepis]
MPFPVLSLNDGNKIPSVAFGSGSVNKGKDIHQYVEQALDAGFTHIDTAQFYANEQFVGLAIQKSGLSREDLFVTSKFGFGNVQDAFRASLKNLGLSYLDLYLIHTPGSVPNGDFEGVWQQFEDFKKSGLVKSIGVSNFTIEDLQKILKVAKIKPAVNQIRLHPYNYAEHAALLDYHAKHGIVTEAYSSLAPITTYPGGPVDAPLKAAAYRLGITPTQVIFLWVRAKGAVIVTTSSNKEHLKEYLAVGDLPPLTEEEVAEIDKAGAQGPPKFSPPPPSYAEKFEDDDRVLTAEDVFEALIGPPIPAIAFGTGTANRSKDVHQYIEQALDTGFTHIDTAQIYENEKFVGVAIRESKLNRDELFVTSKYGDARTTVKEAFHTTLKDTGLKQLDLYLIHFPRVIPNGDYEGIWKEFEGFKEAGLTKSIGVSNFAIGDLEKLLKTAKIKPAVNQIQLHPYNIAQNAALLDYHAKHGIITEAYSSLIPITRFPGGPVDAPLQAAATRLGITPTQVIFLWVRAKGAVVVTTSSSKDHLKEYLAVGDLPPLTEDEVAAIDKAGAQGPPRRSPSSPPAYSVLSPDSKEHAPIASISDLESLDVDVLDTRMRRRANRDRIVGALGMAVWLSVLYLMWVSTGMNKFLVEETKRQGSRPLLRRMPFPYIPLNDGNKIPSIAFGTGGVRRIKDPNQFIRQGIETGFTHIDAAQGVIQNDDYQGIWKEFEVLKEAGLTKSIGVSNFKIDDFEKLFKTAKIKPAVNQIKLHPYNIAENAELLEYHAKHGIVTEAYSSLIPIRNHPGGPIDAPINAAAQRLGITPTQVIFLWVRAKRAVIVTTSSSKEHLEEYLAVGDLPPLTDEEVAAIDKAGAQGAPPLAA